jgi:CDP-diacylglycerol---glycerol-3-phosphate 3-phosphatidyltransferase
MLTSLPNLLTLSRIAVIPILIACALFSLAAITDYFDGHFARSRRQVSTIGVFLDPIADKLLVAAVILLLAGFDHIKGLAILPAMVILCREILVSGLREFLAGLRVRVPVSRLAKWKTGIQMVALGFLIVGNAGPDFLPVTLIGVIGLWIAAILTLLTGYDYLVTGLKHMTDETATGAHRPNAAKPRSAERGL